MNWTTRTALIATLAATPSVADEFSPHLQGFLDNEISKWSSASVLIDAITAQNDRTQEYDQARIDELDQAWRAEVGASESPTISPVLNNAAADFLRQQVASSGGAITEIFIMDAHGLNVAASDVTSDYWQGDEAKFQQTHGAGPGAVHISDVELDESTQRYQGQVSIAISHPETGQLIGAMTVGVDVDSLM